MTAGSAQPHVVLKLKQKFHTPAVVGKRVKPDKTITEKPTKEKTPKEKTEAKIDKFNPAGGVARVKVIHL